MALSVNIQKRLGGFHLEVQFETEEGVLALLGASGCGKSVTLRCIAGIMTPDEGRIELDGVTLFDSAAGINLPPQRRRTGYLFQQYALFPNMTVRQNIAAVIQNRACRQARTGDLLRRFCLEDAAELRPRQLSGGQQQRAALARILAAEPRAILLDEPLSALDSFLKRQLELELAETLEHFQGTALWVSHDREEVFRNCRQVCLIDRGRSQGIRTLEDLLRHPDTEAAARLSGCENLVDVLPAGTTVQIPSWGVTLDCGRPVPEYIRLAGIRAQHLLPAKPETRNAFSCRVDRAIRDMFSTVVLLRPTDAAPGAPPLRMELDRTVWEVLPHEAGLTVSVAPENILFLRKA